MTRARHAIVLVAVAATAAAACGCDDSSSSGAASAPKRQQLPAPTVSEADSPFRVRLSWTMPAGAKVDGFELARDGDAIATLPSTATHYVDRDVSPKSYHVYSVVATRGSHHSQAGMVDAKLAMPKLADARLEGYFNVRLKLVSSSGYKDDIPSTRTVGWHFKPLCRHGACDVIWRDTSSKAIHAHAERHGSSYRVTFNGWYYSTCNGAHATSTVGIKLRVTRGRVEDGRWLVSRLQGTFDKSEAAQLGCISSSESTKALGRFTN